MLIGYTTTKNGTSRYTGVDTTIWGVSSYDGWNYETEFGNRLVSMRSAANPQLVRTFTYDANGMRTRRVEPDGTVYEYVYNGSLLTQMTIDNGATTSVEYTMYFTYDAAGVPVSVTLNDITYFYVTNLQGDVIAILDYNGYAVATYVYNAWGDILADSCYILGKGEFSDQIGYIVDHSDDAIGRLNPLRYRGYVYDTETKLYYLQSRYYNPEWGRFLTADNPDYLGADGTVTSYNLFAYCSNNPVMYSDPTGNFSILVFAISIGVSLTFEMIEDAIDGGLFDGSHDWKDYLGAGISGAFGGLGGGSAAQAVFALVGGFADAALSGDLVQDGLGYTLGNIVVSSLISFGVGEVTNRLAAKIKANSLRKLTNNDANRKLKAMGAKIKIGSHVAKANKSSLENAIRKESKWIGNVICKDLIGATSGGLASIGVGYVWNKISWHYEAKYRVVL